MDFNFSVEDVERGLYYKKDPNKDLTSDELQKYIEEESKKKHDKINSVLKKNPNYRLATQKDYEKVRKEKSNDFTYVSEVGEKIFEHKDFHEIVDYDTEFLFSITYNYNEGNQKYDVLSSGIIYFDKKLNSVVIK